MTGFRWEYAQLRILSCAVGLIQPAGLACFFGHHGEGVRPLLPADAQGPRLAPADTPVGRPLVVAGGGGDLLPRGLLGYEGGVASRAAGGEGPDSLLALF